MDKSKSHNDVQLAFSLHYPGKRHKSFSLDVSLSIPAQGVTAIFGASGSGKTTLLRCMAGLERAQSGRFQLGQITWQSESYFMPIHERQQGVVFQEASLFAHLSVKGNLDYAHKRAAKRLTKLGNTKPANTIDDRQIITLLGIEHLLDQYPATLSGGERQRVAIARALLSQPRILLMDEPLAALDYKRKQEILPYLEGVSKACSIPIVYITHSLDEVARLADYLVVMDKGRVVAQGELQEVLSRVDLPVSLDNELGVVLKAHVVEKDTAWHLMRVEFEGGSLWLKSTDMAIRSPIRVRVLAKDISISLASQDSSILNILPAKVIDVVDDADEAMALVRLQVGENILISRLTKRSVDHLSLESGLNVWAQIKSVAILP